MSGATSAITATHVKRVAVGAAKGAGFGLVVFACGALIFQDADFYAARDKWEHFKIAIFGDWYSGVWCPPGRKGGKCRGADNFRERLAGMEGFTFFLNEPVEGTDLDVTTGIRFATAEDVVSGKPEKFWCYLMIGNGAVTRKLTLANKAHGELAVPADLSGIAPDALSGMSLKQADLPALVASHCRFDAAHSPNHIVTGE
jgi:hypothetical protein